MIYALVVIAVLTWLVLHWHNKAELLRRTLNQLSERYNHNLARMASPADVKKAEAERDRHWLEAGELRLRQDRFRRLFAGVAASLYHTGAHSRREADSLVRTLNEELHLNVEVDSEAAREQEKEAVSWTFKWVDLGQSLDDLARDQAEWSQKTFGADAERGPEGALRHLAKEAEEALAKPRDLVEYADCLLLLLDASRRAGFTPLQLLKMAQWKMEKNKLRKWPPPVEGVPCEHLAEGWDYGEAEQMSAEDPFGRPHLYWEAKARHPETGRVVDGKGTTKAQAEGRLREAVNHRERVDGVVNA